MGKWLRIFFFFVNIIAITQSGQGQQIDSVKLANLPPDTLAVHDSVSAKVVPQKDIGDLAKALFRIKSSTKKENVKIIRPVFSAVPALGYTLTTRLAATLSANCAFRTGNDSKLSTIVASAAYTQNKQFTFPFQSNVWTPNNKYNFLGDYRFYKYPQSTFGLGTNSWIRNENPMDYSYARAAEVLLRNVYKSFYAGGGLIDDIHWNISEKGVEGATTNDYESYGAEKKTVSAGFTLNTLWDSRDNAINPSHGFYSSLQYRNNLTAFGSTRAWSSLIIDIRKYYHLRKGSPNVLAFWSYNWLVIHGKPPYLDLPSTSWDQFSSTGVGYIQGRFRGAQMVYFETQYRFRITRNGLIGGVLFVNAQCFSAAPGTALQSVQPGIGPGLRIKLNKVSNTNISIDYGFGTEGSQGLFINIGELF